MKLTDVAIVAVEGFSPFHYAVPCMLFGDSVSEIKRFNLHICAERPGLLSARDGFALYATGDYAALEQADIVVVPYWGEVDRRPPQALLDSPVRARDNGAEIVGLCLGAFVLGYAGLLDGRRAATHWEFEQDFQRRFPQVQLDINALYVDDQRIITSAGTAAALDCCLYIIRQRFGSLAANQIARRMIVSPHREGGRGAVYRPAGAEKHPRCANQLPAGLSAAAYCRAAQSRFAGPGGGDEPPYPDPPLRPGNRDEHYRLADRRTSAPQPGSA